MSEQLEEVERIGVFVNESPATIAAVFARAGLTGVQIHGDEPPQQVREVIERLQQISAYARSLNDENPGPGRLPLRIIKTICFNSEFKANLQKFSDPGLVDAILVDNSLSQQRGGTGKVYDWQAARAALGKANHRRVIVAGGLKQENVQQALAIFQPLGVDVASGLEREPGKKDPAKLMEFCRKVRDYRAAVRLGRENN